MSQATKTLGDVRIETSARIVDVPNTDVRMALPVIRPTGALRSSEADRNHR
jgi:hypothetical protein